MACQSKQLASCDFRFAQNLPRFSNIPLPAVLQSKQSCLHHIDTTCCYSRTSLINGSCNTLNSACLRLWVMFAGPNKDCRPLRVLCFVTDIPGSMQMLRKLSLLLEPQPRPIVIHGVTCYWSQKGGPTNVDNVDISKIEKTFCQRPFFDGNDVSSATHSNHVVDPANGAALSVAP